MDRNAKDRIQSQKSYLYEQLEYLSKIRAAFNITDKKYRENLNIMKETQSQDEFVKAYHRVIDYKLYKNEMKSDYDNIQNLISQSLISFKSESCEQISYCQTLMRGMDSECVEYEECVLAYEMWCRHDVWLDEFAHNCDVNIYGDKNESDQSEIFGKGKR